MPKRRATVASHAAKQQAVPRKRSRTQNGHQHLRDDPRAEEGKAGPSVWHCIIHSPGFCFSPLQCLQSSAHSVSDKMLCILLVM